MIDLIEQVGSKKMMFCVCDNCQSNFKIGWKISLEQSLHNFCNRICYYEWRKDIKNHPHWKGGEVKMQGYVFLKVEGHPYGNELGYVKRSRLIMEAYLGRYLLPEETMHHINEIRDDDRIENFKLCSSLSEHGKCEHSRVWTKHSKQLVLQGV